MQRLTALGLLPTSVAGTAGSSAKRYLLRALGLRRVVSSRSTAFVSDLAVSGAASDVVLNTLTSPGMLAASLAGMVLGGSFVELSKRCAASSQGLWCW